MSFAPKFRILNGNKFFGLTDIHQLQTYSFLASFFSSSFQRNNMVS